MADFCLKCFNEMTKCDYDETDVIEEWGICEGCGEYKKVVVDLRGHGLLGTLGRLIISIFKKRKGNEV